MNATELFKHLRSGLITSIILCCCVGFSFAQPVLPQRTITVTPTQALDFGRFCVTGAGGTVTVDYDGTRTSTGGIALIGTPNAHPAIFEIKLCEGRTVNISFASTTTLSNGSGGYLTLTLGPTERGGNGVTFFTNSDCNFVTPLRVGGALQVPGGADTGSYSGSFAITFIQE